MTFHGFFDISAVEIAFERQQREIHCVDGKDVAMYAFIVPRGGKDRRIRNNAPRCSDRL